MRKLNKLVFFSALCSLTLLTGCGEAAQQVETVAESAEENTEEEIQLVEHSKDIPEWENTAKIGITSREKYLLAHLANGKNACISPAGLYACLDLARCGAAGNTLSQIDSYLGTRPYDISSDTVLTANYGLFRDKSEIGSAPKDSFKSALIDKGTSLMEIKRASASKRVVALNKEIETFTHGQITDAIREDYVTRDDFVACLANVIYFNATWDNEDGYEVQNNYEFRTASGKTVKCDALDIYNGTYFSTSNVQGFQIPYKEEDQRYTFYAFLPMEEGEFDYENLDLTDFEFPDVNSYDLVVHMPKFEFSNEYEMAGTLASAGLSDLFDPSLCDMSNGFDIPAGKNVYFSNVVQKTKVKLDEKGTEASAVTSMYMMEAACALEQKEEITLDFNRPFLWMIYDAVADVPLFVGQICNPNE